KRDLARLASFFDFDYEDDRNVEAYLTEAKRGVQDWIVAKSKEPDQRPRLDALYCADGRIVISDTRDCATAGAHELTGTAAQIFSACDAAQRVSSLLHSFSDVDETEVRALLAELQDQKLLVEMEDEYLSLPVIRSRPAQLIRRQLRVYQQLPQATAA